MIRSLFITSLSTRGRFLVRLVLAPAVTAAVALSACGSDPRRAGSGDTDGDTAGISWLPPAPNRPVFDDSLPEVDEGALPPVAEKKEPRAERCHPNYDPCVPIDSDVDCAGGSGNGPSYVDGPVRVIGRDPYRLDRDRDGVACEN